ATRRARAPSSSTRSRSRRTTRASIGCSPSSAARRATKPRRASTRRRPTASTRSPAAELSSELGQRVRAPAVLFDEPLPERLEVLDHRARREVRTGLRAQDLAPVPAGSLLEDRAQELADVLASVVARVGGILVQDALRDVVVELEQEDVRERVVVVRRRIVRDVRLRRR